MLYFLPWSPIPIPPSMPPELWSPIPIGAGTGAGTGVGTGAGGPPPHCGFVSHGGSPSSQQVLPGLQSLFVHPDPDPEPPELWSPIPPDPWSPIPIGAGTGAGTGAGGKHSMSVHGEVTGSQQGLSGVQSPGVHTDPDPEPPPHFGLSLHGGVPLSQQALPGLQSLLVHPAGTGAGTGAGGKHSRTVHGEVTGSQQGLPGKQSGWVH